LAELDSLASFEYLNEDIRCASRVETAAKTRLGQNSCRYILQGIFREGNLSKYVENGGKGKKKRNVEDF